VGDGGVWDSGSDVLLFQGAGKSAASSNVGSMILGILSAIGAAFTLIEHLFIAFNNAPVVQAKVAQMTQDEKDKHRALVKQAMSGTPEQRAAALEQLRELAAE
jgi:hypothetical protein